MFTIIGHRMKHNRTSWSIAGANNMAAILSLYHTGMLRQALRDWTAHGDPRNLYVIKAPLTGNVAPNYLWENPVFTKDDNYLPPHIISGISLPRETKELLTTKNWTELTYTTEQFYNVAPIYREINRIGRAFFRENNRYYFPEGTKFSE